MDFLAKLEQIEAFVTMFAEFINSNEHSIEEKKEFLSNNQEQIKSCMEGLGTIKEYILGNDDPDDDKYIVDIDRIDTTLSGAVDHLSQEIKSYHSCEEEDVEDTETVNTTKKVRTKKGEKKLFTHVILLNNGDVINVIAKTKKDLIEAITDVTDNDNGLDVEAIYKVSFEEVHVKKKVTYTIE